MTSLLNKIKEFIIARLNSSRKDKSLKNSGLFKSLNRKQFKTLSRLAKQVNFQSGELILKEGDIGNDCYLIQKGEVRIFVLNAIDAEIVLAHLSEGDYFGEQALLEENPGQRNASVKAITDVSLIKVSRRFKYRR